MKHIFTAIICCLIYSAQAQSTTKYLTWMFSMSDSCVKYHDTIDRLIPIYPGPWFSVKQENRKTYILDSANAVVAERMCSSDECEIRLYNQAILDSVDAAWNRYSRYFGNGQFAPTFGYAHFYVTSHIFSFYAYSYYPNK